MCGFPPFYEENNQKLFDMIKAGTFDFPSPYWDDVSEVAKDLIRNILQVDPKKRLTAEEISAHPWVVGTKTPRTELPNVTDKIKEYNNKRRFKVSYNILYNGFRGLLTWSLQPIGSRTFLRPDDYLLYCQTQFLISSN